MFLKQVTFVAKTGVITSPAMEAAHPPKHPSQQLSRVPSQREAIEQQQFVIGSATIGVENLFIALVGPVRFQQHGGAVAIAGRRDVGFGIGVVIHEIDPRDKRNDLVLKARVFQPKYSKSPKKKDSN